MERTEAWPKISGTAKRKKPRSRLYAGLSLALPLLCFTDIAVSSTCHRYKTWRYPWPQSCGVGVKQAKRIVWRQPTMTLPLPSMVWIECPQGDESLERIALLRAAFE